jgi:ribonuclease P protein component
VIACENTVGHPRLGLAVGVRVARSAVQRNRLKRLVRDWFRFKQHETPALDIVVNARSAAARAPDAVLAASLAAHWDRLRQRCARS